MRVAQKVAGYSLAEADNLRKACGKKIRELIAEEREKFVDGCEATGYGRELGTALFDIIEPFADYAFNKSHAFGYGLVAYQTAYLKAHYPVEYFACLLTSVKSSLEKAAVYIAECRAMGIKVLNPDINRSVTDFAALAPAGGPRGRRPAGRQPRRDHVRALRRAQRRRRSRRPPAGRTGRERAVHELLRLRRAGARAGAQQAHRGVVDQGRRVRLARAHPQGPAQRVRAHHRHDDHPPPRARAGRDEPVRRLGRRRRRRTAATRPSTSAPRSPRPSSTRPTSCATRRRCSGCTCPTTPCSGSRRRCGARSSTPSPTSASWATAPPSTSAASSRG